tara:strand:+ start:209 stop:463 length:255 start_codon:yes stop_codon:yes gene_type:complete
MRTSTCVYNHKDNKAKKGKPKADLSKNVTPGNKVNALNQCTLIQKVLYLLLIHSMVVSSRRYNNNAACMVHYDKTKQKEGGVPV